MSDSPLILLVDDEPPVTHVLGLKLRQLGLDVVTARDGEEGFDLACVHRPAAIVSDFQMPVLSGYDMARALHDHEPTAEIPILMLTARGHTLTEQQLAQTNIVRLMDKPFSANELSQAVGELVGPNSASSVRS